MVPTEEFVLVCQKLDKAFCEFQSDYFYRGHPFERFLDIPQARAPGWPEDMLMQFSRMRPLHPN